MGKKDVKNLSDNLTNMISRDISWLDFNRRVLVLALDDNVPFLERLKFLAISSSNLDEFIRVRLTKLYRAALDAPNITGISGITADEEFEKVLELIKEFRDIQDGVYDSCISQMEKKKSARISTWENLDGEQKKRSRQIFINTILPSLTPIAYESTKETPFMKTGDLGIIVEASEYRNAKSIFTFIQINKVFDRLHLVDSKSNTYILIEDLIKNNLHYIFNKKEIHYAGCFRVIRQGDIDLDTDNEISIVDRMIEFLYRREKSDAIFMEVENKMPKHIIKILKNVVDIKNKFIKKSHIMDYRFFFNDIEGIHERFSDFKPQESSEFMGDDSIMSVIRNEDVILHHPYDSYDPVVKLIQEAAEDKNVLVIRNTLYRVSSKDSPIVEALCTAARNGKNVSVLLELKARFDEDQNISIIEKLNKAGCSITYGMEKYKVHAKFLSILRKGKNGELEYYTHLATGNYNDKTAKMYTDISYFTSDKKIGDDVINVFNFISGFTSPNPIKSKRIFYSPFTLRNKIEKLIDKEIDNVKDGREGKVILKLNAISDKRMINKIYSASKQGVKFELIVRGVCSIKPINGNINIKSIVGRYLEHSRIYYFHNDGKAKVFISSADLLTRNLDKRVELLTEITEDLCKRKVINVLRINLKDTYNSFVMNEKGTFKIPDKSIKNGVNLFDEFINISKNEFYLPKKRNKI